MTRDVLFLAYLCCFVLTPLMHAVTWRPVTAQELALKKSKSDPDADVEGLFREVRVLNESRGFSYPQNVISEYIRLKIFTDRGKDKYGAVQIPYWGKSNIYDVGGVPSDLTVALLSLVKTLFSTRSLKRKTEPKSRLSLLPCPLWNRGRLSSITGPETLVSSSRVTCPWMCKLTSQWTKSRSISNRSARNM